MRLKPEFCECANIVHDDFESGWHAYEDEETPGEVWCHDLGDEIFVCEPCAIECLPLTKSDLEYGDEIEVMEDWIAMEFMKMRERMNEDMKKSTKKQKNYSNSFSTFLKG